MKPPVIVTNCRSLRLIPATITLPSVMIGCFELSSQYSLPVRSQASKPRHCGGASLRAERQTGGVELTGRRVPVRNVGVAIAAGVSCVCRPLLLTGMHTALRVTVTRQYYRHPCCYSDTEVPSAHASTDWPLLLTRRLPPPLPLSANPWVNASSLPGRHGSGVRCLAKGASEDNTSRMPARLALKTEFLQERTAEALSQRGEEGEGEDGGSPGGSGAPQITIGGRAAAATSSL